MIDGQRDELHFQVDYAKNESEASQRFIEKEERQNYSKPPDIGNAKPLEDYLP